jgi:hypothetical protein
MQPFTIEPFGFGCQLLEDLQEELRKIDETNLKLGMRFSLSPP